MTFRHPQNHLWSFPTDVLLVCQLLARDSSAHKHALDKRRRCNLFLGVYTFFQHNSRDQSSSWSFCPILQSPNRSRGPILHYGSFRLHRHSIPSAPGDLDLYTDMEISCLKTLGYWSRQSPAHEILAQHHFPPRQRQPHPSRGETTEILRVTAVLLVCGWKLPGGYTGST